MSKDIYKVGDKVRLKVLSRYDSELIQSINNLPDRTATIKQVNKNERGYISYNLEEISWEIGKLEIDSLIQRKKLGEE